jgi:hypothetical protein
MGEATAWGCGVTGNSENDGGDKDVTFLGSVNLLVRPPGSIQERSESEWSSFHIIPFLSRSHCIPSAMSTSLPTAKVIQVDTRGAVILDEASPEVRALSTYYYRTTLIDDMARPEIVEAFTCQTTLNLYHILRSTYALVSHYFVTVFISPTGRRLPCQGSLFHPFTRSAVLSLCTCDRWKQLPRFDIDTLVSVIRWPPFTTTSSELFTPPTKRCLDTLGTRHLNESFWEWTVRFTRELAS